MIKIDIKKRVSIIMISIAMFIILMSYFVKGVPFSFTLVLLIWTAMFIYSLMYIEKHVTLLFFLVSFFVFLVGREACFIYLGVTPYYEYLNTNNDKTFYALSLSLTFIAIGSLLRKEKHDNVITDDNYERHNYYRNISLLGFIVSYTLALIATGLDASNAIKNGYLEGYTSEGTENSLPGVVNYGAAFVGVAISFYLASKPKKHHTLIILVLYEVYGIATLLTGHRYTFISITMYAAVVIVIRGWLKFYHFLVAIIILPFTLILLTALDSIRVGNSYHMTNIFETIVTFFDQQGGSVNVIKRVMYYESSLTDMRLVSLYNLRTVSIENSLMRWLFDLKVYSGNSIENALHGNSLAHRLSYYEYGSQYLAGRGVGSSYIGELYHDFGYLGVSLGSMLYGYILKCINYIKFNNLLKDTLLLSCFSAIILAPRGNFDGFIGDIFNLYTLLGIVLIYLIANIFANRRLG